MKKLEPTLKAESRGAARRSGGDLLHSQASTKTSFSLP